MSASNLECEELFQVDQETATALCDLGDEDLRSFAAIEDSHLDDGQCKVSSYAYFLLFKRTGSSADLQEGISLVDQWLDRIPDGHSQKECPKRISEMMSGQLAQKNRANSEPLSDIISDIRLQDEPFDGIDIHTGTITETVDVHELSDFFRGSYLNDLGVELSKKFQPTDPPEKLNHPIELLEEAVSLASHEATQARRKTNLAGCYATRFERTGCTEDLNVAIKLTNEAIAIDFRDPSELACSFSGLETFMSSKFERFRQHEDLEEAVHAAEMAVALSPHGDPYLPGRLNNLANRLSTRYEQYGAEDDLVKAIELMNNALNGPFILSNSDKAIYLNNLGQRLYLMFRIRTSVKFLARSLEAAQESVDIASQEGYNGLPSFLNNLAIAHQAHFEQFGTLEHLDKSIEHTGAAVDMTPPDHPDILHRMKNLGSALLSRSFYTGSLDDINRSIEVLNTAINRLPDNHPARAELLSDLSSSFNKRFDRSLSLTDLQESLNYSQRAVDFEPANPSRRLTLLNNHANILGRYAEETDATDSLSKAIEHMRTVVQDTASGDVDRPSRFCNLGNWLGHRFRTNFNKGDIDEAITFTEEAYNMLPPEHLDRAVYIVNLGTWYSERFEAFGDQQDQLYPLSLYKMGSELATATPFIRIELAFRAAKIHADRKEWKESSKLMESAIDLFPTVSLRSLKHTDKQDMLGRFFGLASDAAAISLNAGNEPYGALQLLERGRGVIAGLLMDMRGGISDLDTKHPDLAQKFRTLRDQLTVPSDQWNFSASNDTIVSYDTRVRQRRAADHDFNDLISKIREETDLHNFLLLPSEQELIGAAQSGPIVIINTSRYRCDAFLIQDDKIRVQRLTDLTLEDLQKHVRVLQSSTSRTDAAMKALLHWLWDTIMRPCLDALGFVKPSSDETLPRVWWVPTGLLSRLPLHATGYYREPAFDSVLDRVISSYALSVKALIHGRQTGVAQSCQHSDRAILVPMKQTPGLTFDGHLPFAEDEVDMLKDMCKPLGLQPVTPEPHKDDVLACVKSCKIFHFAGHGSSDPVEPSKSCLILNDWKTNALTVEDFRDYHIGENPPFLGYLSACSTGANTVTKLADEGIHLISSLQLAGFQRVVGTLWEVSDKYCVDVARDFYKTLQEEGLTDISICRALHKATKALRDGQISAEMKTRYAVCVDFDEPIKVLDNFHWVPYIHFGC